MQMTESEICVNYRQAKNKKEQIGILADLNGVKKQEIVDILSRNGFFAANDPQAKRKAAPTAPTAEAAKPSKEESKQVKNSTKPQKNQAATMVPETVSVSEDKSGEPLEMIAQMQNLLRVAPEMIDSGKITACMADGKSAMVHIARADKLYSLTLEVL